MTQFRYEYTLSKLNVEDAGPARWLHVGVSACCAFVVVFVYMVVALECNAPWVVDGGISRC